MTIMPSIITIRDYASADAPALLEEGEPIELQARVQRKHALEAGCRTERRLAPALLRRIRQEHLGSGKIDAWRHSGGS